MLGPSYQFDDPGFRSPGITVGPDGTMYNSDGSVVPDTGPGGMTGRVPQSPYGPSQTGNDLMTGSTHDFNPNTGLSREQYRDMWMNSGASNLDQMRNFLSQYGGNLLAGNGTVQTPYGDTLDMGTAFRTGNGRPGWTTVNSSGNDANGSVMNNGGSNNIMQFISQLLGSIPQSNMQLNTGAQPYNPYANMGQGVSNYFQNKQPTGQTDGTLLGTSFSPSNSVTSMNQNNNMQTGINRQPQSQSRGYKTGFGPSPMNSQMNNGMTDYSQKNENFQSKPLPANNLVSNF